MAIAHNPNTGQPLLAPRSVKEFKGFVTEKNSDWDSVARMIYPMADMTVADVPLTSLSESARADVAELKAAHQQWMKSSTAGKQYRQHQVVSTVTAFLILGIVIVIGYLLFW